VYAVLASIRRGAGTGISVAKVRKIVTQVFDFQIKAKKIKLLRVAGYPAIGAGLNY